MAATAKLYRDSLQNSLHDSNTLVDQAQYLSTFFCRALYDYQSRDASSLSFHKGDIIEVLTQLDSGWWDGLLHDERGWFPSNYVAPVSEQEIEEELSAARLQQGTHWAGEQRTEPAATGSSSDFWVPQVAGDGRIFYVNTQTGERSNELPTEAEAEPEPLVTNAFTSPSSTSAYATAFSRSTTTLSSTSTIATAPSPVAGFGLPKRSGTPEPWVKRLADDGMSYYYLNTIDSSIRWTAPSPPPDHPSASIHDSFTQQNGHQRADSAASGNRLSVYSDDSDVNPLGILGRVAAHEHSRALVTASTPTPGHQRDEEPALRSARELQTLLQDQFAPPPESLEDLAQTARMAVTGLLDVAFTRTSNIDLKDAIKRVTDAIRNLIHASSTLLGSLTSLPPPFAIDNASFDNSELKQFHRKVSATMVKLVSAVRASASEVPSDDNAPGRFDIDVTELENAIATFVNEVLSRRGPYQAARRVRAVLLSADGAKGVGPDSLGAGAAGAWKGFGFVEPLTGESLGPEIIAVVKQHKNGLDGILTELGALVSGEQGPAIVVHGQDAIRHLVSFLALIAEINVARALDLDSSSLAVADPPYLQSVTRAKTLVRALEAAVQAVFEDGAVLLNASQSVSVARDLLRAVAPGERRPLDTLVSAIFALRRNTDDVCGTIEALVELAQFQANECAKAGVDASIGLRDVRLRVINEWNSAPEPEPNAQEAMPPEAMDYGQSPAQGHYDSDEDGMIDFGDALGARPGKRGRSESQNGSTSSLDRDRAMGSQRQLESQNSTLVGHSTPPPEEEELGEEEDFGLGTSSKSPQKAQKIMKLLGPDAPQAYIKMANADSKPWYLRAEHGAKDIFMTPDGGVRGGTLPALIERLTMHDNRDTVFNNTFLTTFKSFTTLDELFDGLIRRFYIQPPPNLSPDERKEWIQQKQVVVRLRVINLFRSMVIDEDVLEKEDMHILDRIKEFASAVDRDIIPPIPAAKQLLVLVDRASGGDAMVKMTQHTPNFPPPAIVPKSNKVIKLLDIDPLELARQLTIMESKLFAKIRPMECLNRGRDGKPGDSDDNISAIIDTSNKVAEWVADAILSKDDSRKRAAIVKQFIAVADRCRHLQNFSTMAALVAGLNSTPIRRLKRTWEQVNARNKAQLQEAERTMDTNKNFNNYRAILKRAQLPCVPFFGVYLSVLTFIQDGNKNMIQGDIINFGKREKFAEVIREIKHYQSKPYNLTTIPSIQAYIDESLSALGNTADLSDRAWNLSLEREPREREDEKMARLLQESGFL